MRAARLRDCPDEAVGAPTAASDSSLRRLPCLVRNMVVPPFAGRVHASTLGRGCANAHRRKGGFELGPADDSDSYSGRRRAVRAWSTVQAMNRFSLFARRYGFDVLIVLAAIAAALEVALRDESAASAAHAAVVRRARGRARCAAAARRRRFPFAAPVALWLLAAALSFVDGRLIVYRERRLRRRHRRRLPARQPARRRSSAHRPGHRRELRSDRHLQRPEPHARRVHRHPAALRDRLARRLRPARAARRPRRQKNARPTPSESASRPPASPSPRSARGSRASFTTSSPTPSASWCSRSEPSGTSCRRRSTEDREALRGVEQAGRTALAEMRRLLGAMRDDGDDVELAPQPGLDSLDALLEEVGRAGLPVRLHVDGDAVPAPARDRPLRLSDRAGRPDQRAQARPRQRRGRDRPLPARRARRSKYATTARAARRATASATGSSASASASRSTAAR